MITKPNFNFIPTMKNFVSISALLALSVAFAWAQPPSGAAKKQEKAAQVVKTTTTTYDTIYTNPATTTVVANDSLLNARFDELEKQIKNIKDNVRSSIRFEMRDMQSDSGRMGNFVVRALQNTIPLMPFVAGILIAFFWFRYTYKRKVLRQEMIYKYIDRGEAVPEWLTRAEAPAEPLVPNEAGAPSRKNATLFLVLSIVFAALAVIWLIALTSSHSWRSAAFSLLGCGGFGAAAVWCFRQYLKRTE